MLVVFKGLDNKEFVLYVYSQIFWKTYEFGQAQESYNRRVAIINFLNEQPEITGMLRGDINENYKLDSDDFVAMGNITTHNENYVYKYPSNAKGQYNTWFLALYFSVAGDTNDDGVLDDNDLDVLNSYLSGTYTKEDQNNFTSKYYPESEECNWIEQELMNY